MMASNSIALVSLHYPPEETGNAPYAGGLAEGLRARGYSVTAFVGHPHYPEWKIRSGYGQWRRSEMIRGVAVHRLRHYVPNPPRGIRRLFSELSFGVRLFFRRYGQHRAVIAVSPALFATALAVLRIRLAPSRPALVVWVQDIYTLGLAETRQGNRVTAMVTEFVESFVLRAADRVVAIHPRFAEYMIKNMGVDPGKIAVVRNWTHLKPHPDISRQAARTALGWTTGELLVVHTGNMGAKQGLENVVRAARLADQRQEPLKFVLVGDGSERTRLQKLARDVTRIEFVDPLDDDAYRLALAAADCLLVNESPGVAEMAVPSKLTSYFDAARPVVAATDPTGITAEELRSANAGVVVPAGDPGALLDAALQLCRDAEGSSAYGSAGRSHCRRNMTAEAAMDAFERVVRAAASALGRPLDLVGLWK